MEENNALQQVQVALPQVTKQDFFKTISEVCTTYKWPKGAIECINPDKTKLVYLWGNRFVGNAEGSWTAKADGTSTIKVNKNEVKIEDGTPYSGPVPQIDFDLLVINDNQATPYWAKDFCKVGFQSDNFQPYSSVAATDGVVEGDDSSNPHAAWMKNGNDIVDNYMLPIAKDISENGAMAYAALNIFPPEIIEQSMQLFSGMKFGSRDVKVSSRNSVLKDPTPVLIPFYLLEFEFEGKTYYLAMMANSNYSLKGQLPPVKDAKTPEQIVEEEMADKVKQAKIVKWGWVLSILLLFVASFKVAVIYLIIWAITNWFVKRSIKSRIKELKNLSAEEDRRTGELLRKQLMK